MIAAASQLGGKAARRRDAKSANADHSPRNRARTPEAVVRHLVQRFLGGHSFDLDAAAEPESAKAAAFFGPGSELAEDAHRVHWGLVGETWVEDPQRIGEPARVYLNPPFRNIGRWVAKAEHEVEEGRAEVVVMIVPVSMSAAWWHAARRSPFIQVHELVGRIAFEAPPGIEYSSPRGDVAILEVRRPLTASALMGGRR